MPAAKRLDSTIGPPGDSRFSRGADASDITRSGDGKRDYIYTTSGSGIRRCGC